MNKKLLGMIVLLLAVPGAMTETEVINGRTPKGTAMTLEFTEDLKFGSDKGGDHYIWSDGVFVEPGATSRTSIPHPFSSIRSPVLKALSAALVARRNASESAGH